MLTGPGLHMDWGSDGNDLWSQDSSLGSWVDAVAIDGDGEEWRGKTKSSNLDSLVWECQQVTERMNHIGGWKCRLGTQGRGVRFSFSLSSCAPQELVKTDGERPQQEAIFWYYILRPNSKVLYRLSILIGKSRILQNPKLFEYWQDTTTRKFHIWPHVMGHTQDTGALKILYKITFRLCMSCIWNINQFCV
jgi:hypothetical protein